MASCTVRYNVPARTSIAQPRRISEPHRRNFGRQVWTQDAGRGRGLRSDRSLLRASERRGPGQAESNRQVFAQAVHGRTSLGNSAGKVEVWETRPCKASVIETWLTSRVVPIAWSNAMRACV